MFAALAFSWTLVSKSNTRVDFLLGRMPASLRAVLNATAYAPRWPGWPCSVPGAAGMLVGTVPVIFPVVVAAGIDPVWFGVFIVLMCEISLISPPVGMTLYVIQAVRKEGTTAQVFAGTIPFFIAMVVMTGLLIAFPQMALWLPRLTFGT